uniref:molybdopterin biosynthesis protein n=1 Tax=Phymatolithon calcareum TaxID=1277942 RepID=UPI0023F01D7D|nr:molybdopterin biosynthesis protein [Phymatolithon calcareum]WEA76795.1 molybdopterin biosynthesis protein [Phymatolithon calcareum]
MSYKKIILYITKLHMLNPLIKPQDINYLNNIEYERYSRHIILEEINEEGQQRIKKAKVLFVGAGGLSSSALLYLTASGIGLIGIIDNDQVEISNLQRQVIYKVNNISNPKVEAAKENLQDLNPLIHIKTYNELLTEKNANSIIANYDIIIDGTDNFKSRNIISQSCHLMHKIHIYGAIEKFIGQISVFNYQNGPNYYNLYDEFSNQRTADCNERGVLSTLPAIIGIVQATEAIKIITGIGHIMNGYLLRYNALNSSLKKIRIKPEKIKRAIKNNTKKKKERKTIQFNTEYILKKDIDNLSENKSYKLIDIREPIEFKLKKLKNSINIPLKRFKKITTIEYIKKKLNQEIIIIYCTNELRSYIASQILNEHQVKHYILRGGLKTNYQ